MARQQTKARGYKGPGKSASRARFTTGAAVVGGIVVAAAIAWFAYRAAAHKPGEQFADLGHEHIQAAADPHAGYNSEPPAAGPHPPYNAPRGIHPRPLP